MKNVDLGVEASNLSINNSFCSSGKAITPSPSLHGETNFKSG